MQASGGTGGPLRPGQRLGLYELLSEIAGGPSSSIWVARLRGAHGFDKLVAVKAIGGARAQDATYREIFLEEARLASAIAHPNVAQVLDIGERDDLVYLVREYVDGDALADIAAAAEAKRHRIPPAILLRILADVCAGLHAAHLLRDRQGNLLRVAHADLTSSRILVSTSGVAKVIGFGAAKAEARHAGAANLGLATLGADKADAPPPYSRIDRHADIWAVGAILRDHLAYLLEVRTEATSRAPGAPALIGELVERALADDPAQRFATAAEMQGAIEATMVALGMPTTTSNVAAFAATHLGDRAAVRGQAIERAMMQAGETLLADSLKPIASTLVPPPGPAAAPLDVPPLDVPLLGAGSAPPRAHPEAHVAASGAPVAAPLYAASMVPSRGGAAKTAMIAGAALLFGALGTAAVLKARSPSEPSGAAVAAAATPARSAAAPAPTCPASMVTIPGGKFYMGSDDDLDLEKPAHHVTLAPYCLDRFEVTTADYKACSDAGDCKRAGTENKWDGITAAEAKTYDPLCNVRDAIARGKHPINCVDWDMAAGFCAAHGGRLPTEAEWEFAARGPDGRKYPWGDEEPGPLDLNACGKECLAWGKKNHVDLEAMYTGDDGWPTTAPVGSFPAGRSRFGVEDVVGNVWEWTADWFAPYDADAHPTEDPKGPPSGEARVIRGGGWNGAYPAWVRPTFRYKNAPDTRSYGIGFRCARSLGTSAAPDAPHP